LLREQLGIPKEQWHTSFQSRFGPTEWLKPYTQATVEQLARDGHKHLAIISPGFAADCIETLEEIALGFAKHSFMPVVNASLISRA